MGGSVILTHWAAPAVREGTRVRLVVERVIRFVGGLTRAREEMGRMGRKREDKRAVERRIAMVQ